MALEEPTPRLERRPFISAVIPALNEEKTVGEVVARTLTHVDEVLVIDDGSEDDTSVVAAKAGGRVLRNQVNRGLMESLRRGFREAGGELIVTLDADGQHDPEDIPLLLEPVLNGEADLALGVRPELPHLSERIITALTSLRVGVEDASTGFRAIRTSLARRMEVHGACTCGTFVLEAYFLGARIVQVPVNVRQRMDGRRRVQTRHFVQTLYVIYDLLRY
jgi:glycosyltransferase involved in cell wall biosynthesis